MVRVDRDLKRCYFYRIKIEGDVKKPNDGRDPSPEFPKSGIPNHDIIPYNPHFRERTSRLTSRPSSNRRISWSREANRVREISPRSDNSEHVPVEEPVKIFYPPPPKPVTQTKSFVNDSDHFVKKKKKTTKKKAPIAPIKPRVITPPEPFYEPTIAPKNFTSVSRSSKTLKKKNQLIKEHRDKRYMAQKQEQAKRKSMPNSSLRKVKSETNLKSIPRESLMKKSDSGKTKHFNPPRWRHVGDRTRTKHSDKNTRSFVSDYYF